MPFLIAPQLFMSIRVSNHWQRSPLNTVQHHKANQLLDHHKGLTKRSPTLSVGPYTRVCWSNTCTQQCKTVRVKTRHQSVSGKLERLHTDSGLLVPGFVSIRAEGTCDVMRVHMCLIVRLSEKGEQRHQEATFWKDKRNQNVQKKTDRGIATHHVRKCVQKSSKQWTGNKRTRENVQNMRTKGADRMNEQC